jgi:hypothetical protein
MSEQPTHKQTLDESFISYLESVLKRDDRAILAHLRRGLGKEAGTAIEMFPYVAPFVQNSYRSERMLIFWSRHYWFVSDLQLEIRRKRQK